MGRKRHWQRCAHSKAIAPCAITTCFPRFKDSSCSRSETSQVHLKVFARLWNAHAPNQSKDSCNASWPSALGCKVDSVAPCPRGLQPLNFIVIPSKARNLLPLASRNCRSLYSNCFFTSAGTRGSGGKSCENPLNIATVFSARLVPSCTAILCILVGE